ncbi:MAG: septal ring lytic transglycosylase RlpA family protein [Methylococcales bacterium]|nr:septal ring lytic transglycosylase RlpA family protein [Methylococcales bacterium]
MKKLIPILSLAVLSSCANTTKTNLVSLSQDISPIEIEATSPITLAKHKNVKKVVAIVPTQPHKIAAKLTAGKDGQGIASWYGDYFHGKKTATGELFDMYAMTAAHNSLPLASYAEITNVANHRTVIVRINDRGPFSDNRVLDLSYSAAKQLGMDTTGVGEVAIKAIPSSQALKQLQKQNQPVYLQVGSFSDKKLAEELQKHLTKQHLSEPKIAASSNKNATLYKVQLPVKSSRHASDLNNKLAKLGFTDTQFVTETN